MKGGEMDRGRDGGGMKGGEMDRGREGWRTDERRRDGQGRD